MAYREPSPPPPEPEDPSIAEAVGEMRRQRFAGEKQMIWPLFVGAVGA